MADCSFPGELRKLDRWILHDAEKRPIRAVGLGFASPTDPSHWASYTVAAEVGRERGLGLGFVLAGSDGLVGIDLDKVLDSRGNFLAHCRALETWVRKLDTFTETSLSKRGLHLFLRAEKETTACRSPACMECGERHVEVYATARFFTMSGRVFGARAKPVARRKQAFSVFMREWVDVPGGTHDYTEYPRDLENWNGTLPEIVVKAALHNKWLEARIERDAAELERFGKFNALHDQSNSGVDHSIVGTLARCFGVTPFDAECTLRWRRATIGALKHEKYYEMTVGKIFTAVSLGDEKDE